MLHRPSTVATLHLAATAAHGVRLFAPLDPSYATRLLAAARTAHAAAHAEPLLVPPDDEGRFGGGPYGDDDTDDRYWAAVELWLTTGDERYRAELAGSDLHTADAFDPAGFDYDRVAAPARIDLALVAPAGPDREGARADLVTAADRLRALQAGQPWGQPYAPPDGWDWGSNGRILANLGTLAAAHELTGSTRFRDAVALGADYLFGRNALGQSYVTGYGAEPPRHLRTRHFGSGALPAGAVAGGANSREYAGFPSDPRLRGRPPQCCYLDEETSETTNDICVRWNAPLVRVADVLS